jgi:hypothetical protein
MKLQNPALIKSHEQIDWVLSRSGMSSWLKSALATARDRDPIDLLNDLEILNHVLRKWSNTCIRSTFEKNTDETRST